MALTSSQHLADALRAELRRKDVNACAGLLRRLISGGGPASVMLSRHAPLVVSALDLTRAVLTRTGFATPTPVKSASLSVLANIAAAADRWRDALVFADPHRQGPHCRPAAHFLAKLMTEGNASAIADWCDSRRVVPCVPTAIARIGVLGGAWGTALAVAERYEGAFAERYSTGVLVPYLASGGHWDHALRVFNAALEQGALVDHALLEGMLDTTARHGHWQASLAMLGVLHRCLVTSELPQRRMTSTYEAIIEGCPDWAAAVGVVAIVAATHGQPSERMVSAALSRCDSAGRWHAAAAVFDYAQRSGVLRGVSRDTADILIRSFRATTQWEQAVQSLQWMGRAHAAAVGPGLTATIDLCDRAGQWDAALRVAADVMDRPSHGLSADTYAAALRACLTGHQWVAAMDVLQKMLDDCAVVPPPMAVCTAIQACIDGGAWHAALAAYARVEQMGPAVVLPPVGLRLTMRAAVAGRRWEEATLLVAAMRRQGLPHDLHTSRCGLWSASAIGSWRTSLALFRAIPGPLRSRKDRELVTSSAATAGPVALGIVSRIAAQRK